MSRTEQFDKKYGQHGAIVRGSIAKVARAGRTQDALKVETQRVRHYRLMARLSSN